MAELSPRSDSDYQFTSSQDWFSHNILIWEPFIAALKDQLAHEPRALEIGSWEGRSASYILSRLCTTPESILVCIDHFDLMQTDAGQARRSRLEHNLGIASARGGGGQYRILDDFSVPALMSILEEEIVKDSSAASSGFDFVYVDGSHEADDTLLDAELAWRLTAQGAVFILDDYCWDKEPLTSVHHPKRGIDAFLALHAGQYETLHNGYQIIIKRTSAPRIGFLTKTSISARARISDAEMGYGIHLVLSVDDGYAMAAAVAIYSAVKSTPRSRITVYIVDCGISHAYWKRLETTCEFGGERVTLVKIELPAGSLGYSDPSWAKVELLSLLPVERVLYLDGDVLVRHDLANLWAADLHEHSLGAVRDIGHPFGHEGLQKGRAPYFNAGVMLLDLSRIRPRIADLTKVVATRSPTKFKDQDALNDFFGNDWAQLDLSWNATGLGTYASYHDEDRATVWRNNELVDLHKDPSIVHFTGPVHPTLATVLNEWVQPWTSKPWGYGGAPGHPFAEEWWKTLDETPWAGYRDSPDHKKACNVAREQAIVVALQRFDDALLS